MSGETRALEWARVSDETSGVRHWHYRISAGYFKVNLGSPLQGMNPVRHQSLKVVLGKFVALGTT